MESFPKDFCLDKLREKQLAEREDKSRSQVPELRALFHKQITEAINAHYKAVLVVVDQPVNYSKDARITVSGEVAKLFSGCVYGHDHMEFCDLDEFSLIDGNGGRNFEFLIVLDPNFAECKVIKAQRAMEMCRELI